MVRTDYGHIRPKHCDTVSKAVLFGVYCIMSLLLIAYPQIERAGLDRIQAYRVQYDRQYTLIAPHFTLIFPVSDVQIPVFVNEVINKIKQVQPISFTLNKSLVHTDDNQLFYEFLLPSTGYDAIQQLHLSLYSGILARHRNPDRPYIPHITIGHADSKDIAIECLRKHWATPWEIKGQINCLSIIQYVNNEVTIIGDYTLPQ